MSELMLISAYAVGTVIGFWFGTQVTVRSLTETIIDSLIEQEYIQTRKTASGETEIIKYWENRDA